MIRTTNAVMFVIGGQTQVAQHDDRGTLRAEDELRVDARHGEDADEEHGDHPAGHERQMNGDDRTRPFELARVSRGESVEGERREETKKNIGYIRDDF